MNLYFTPELVVKAETIVSTAIELLNDSFIVKINKCNDKSPLLYYTKLIWYNNSEALRVNFIVNSVELDIELILTLTSSDTMGYTDTQVSEVWHDRKTDNYTNDGNVVIYNNKPFNPLSTYHFLTYYVHGKLFNKPFDNYTQAPFVQPLYELMEELGFNESNCTVENGRLYPHLMIGKYRIMLNPLDTNIYMIESMPTRFKRDKESDTLLAKEVLSKVGCKII